MRQFVHRSRRTLTNVLYLPTPLSAASYRCISGSPASDVTTGNDGDTHAKSAQTQKPTTKSRNQNQLSVAGTTQELTELSDFHTTAQIIMRPAGRAGMLHASLVWFPWWPTEGSGGSEGSSVGARGGLRVSVSLGQPKHCVDRAMEADFRAEALRRAQTVIAFIQNEQKKKPPPPSKTLNPPSDERESKSNRSSNISIKDEIEPTQPASAKRARRKITRVNMLDDAEEEQRAVQRHTFVDDRPQPSPALVKNFAAQKKRGGGSSSAPPTDAAGSQDVNLERFLLSPKQLTTLNTSLSSYLSRHHSSNSKFLLNPKVLGRDLNKGKSIDTLAATKTVHIQAKRRRASQSITHKGHQLQHFRNKGGEESSSPAADGNATDAAGDGNESTKGLGSEEIINRTINNTRWPILLGYCLGEDNVALQRRVDGRDDFLCSGGGSMGGGVGTIDEAEGLGGAHFRLECCFLNPSTTGGSSQDGEPASGANSDARLSTQHPADNVFTHVLPGSSSHDNGDGGMILHARVLQCRDSTRRKVSRDPAV